MPHLTAIVPLHPDDSVGCEQVTALLNEVYAATEGPMWPEGGQRTTLDEVRSLAGAGQVHVHVLDTPDGGQVQGTIWTTVDGDRAELGRLGVRPDTAGQGLGTALVAYAEELARAAGAVVMELVVARPRDLTLPAKEKLGIWYPRLGYTFVGTVDVADVHPELADVFVLPVVIDRYEKSLRTVALS